MTFCRILTWCQTHPKGGSQGDNVGLVDRRNLREPICQLGEVIVLDTFLDGVGGFVLIRLVGLDVSSCFLVAPSTDKCKVVDHGDSCQFPDGVLVCVDVDEDEENAEDELVSKTCDPAENIFWVQSVVSDTMVEFGS